ncbi:hypothetical protein SAMN05216311_10298 [Chitinophaga sp. CF418]|nr:hypothetical protein SAMN05216311_10298 [Chitinophaga sp. CF418]
MEAGVMIDKQLPVGRKGKGGPKNWKKGSKEELVAGRVINTERFGL